MLIARLKKRARTARAAEVIFGQLALRFPGGREALRAMATAWVQQC